jgi:hypothetical protein
VSGRRLRGLAWVCLIGATACAGPGPPSESPPAEAPADSIESPGPESVAPSPEDEEAARARECHETADRMAARGLEDYARRIRATCPEL